MYQALFPGPGLGTRLGMSVKQFKFVILAADSRHELTRLLAVADLLL